MWTGKGSRLPDESGAGGRFALYGGTYATSGAKYILWKTDFRVSAGA